MSFSATLKSELCKTEASTCCRLAECYGMLLFSRALFSDFIYFTAENEDVVEHLSEELRYFFGVHSKISGSGLKKEIFTLTAGEDDTDRIKQALNSSEHSVIKHHNISDECCKQAFLRGAFLACGYIDDPNKDYNLEFVIGGEKLAAEFWDFLKEAGFKAKKSLRGKSTVLYFKDSEKIEDILTTIGAGDKTLELAGIKVYKDMRNHINRINNCETANIDKTVNASVEQRTAIEALKKSGVLSELSDELKSTAKIRTENPEASLNELCHLCGGISRSGLNHRLRRLIAIAKDKNLI